MIDVLIEERVRDKIVIIPVDHIDMLKEALVPENNRGSDKLRKMAVPRSKVLKNRGNPDGYDPDKTSVYDISMCRAR